MDAWENDRRRRGGAGWILDDSGEWVATSAEPEVRPGIAAAPVEVPGSRQRGDQGRGLSRGLLTVVVIPALAAAAVLYVWKGPGGEIAVSRIEPLVAAFLAPPATGSASAGQPAPQGAARPRARPDMSPATGTPPTFPALSQSLPSLS